jgi:hypothetical protein
VRHVAPEAVAVPRDFGGVVDGGLDESSAELQAASRRARQQARAARRERWEGTVLEAT